MSMRMRRRHKATLGSLFLLLGGLLIVYGHVNFHDTASLPLHLSLSGQPRVVKVDDGDTIVVDIGTQRKTIRLVGMDTPEVVDPRKPVQCFGREASARAHAIFKLGSTVRLENDPQAGTTDKYGRTLAYVWLSDGTLYNDMMIRQGFAHEYTYENTPYKYQTMFRADQAYAQAHQLGFWNPNTCNGDTTQAAK